MTRTLAIVAVFAAAVGTATEGRAVVINIDFNIDDSHPNGPVSAPYTGLGAAPDGGTTWNQLTVVDDNNFQGDPGEFGFWDTTVTLSNLVTSTGSGTSIGVTAIASADTGSFGIRQAAPNLGAVATDAVDLMRDYLIGFNDPQSVVLNGFAPGTVVDLYLYGAGDTNNRDTTFSVTDTGGVHTAVTTGSLTSDGNNPVTHTLTEGGDYVVLRGVLADGSGEINITYDNGAGSGEGPFNGLQAVYFDNVVPGDTDGDQDVDMVDYQNILANFRNSGATRGQGDLTNPTGVGYGDGVVDFYDFIQWQENFPTAGPSSSTFVVPEPASALIVLGAVASMLCQPRRRGA